jgi:hypothetical protein
VPSDLHASELPHRAAASALLTANVVARRRENDGVSRVMRQIVVARRPSTQSRRRYVSGVRLTVRVWYLALD